MDRSILVRATEKGYRGDKDPLGEAFLKHLTNYIRAVAKRGVGTRGRHPSPTVFLGRFTTSRHKFQPVLAHVM